MGSSEQQAANKSLHETFDPPPIFAAAKISVASNAAELRRFGGTQPVELLSFLEAVSRWAESREDVVGLALIGSHARNAARPDSDIDLTVLCESLEALVNNQDWAALFGNIRENRTERYGPTRSVRVFYENGLEVEFGIAEISWAEIPLDSGTRRVISDGIRILYDRNGLLEEAENAAG